LSDSICLGNLAAEIPIYLFNHFGGLWCIGNVW
jgi:hypothetical protein